LIPAVTAGFYWGEVSDNCPPVVGAFAHELSPGTWAALKGYWRGKNRYENEKVKKLPKPPKGTKSESGEEDIEEKRRKRYAGQG
jgi:hypothetical protein